MVPIEISDDKIISTGTHKKKLKIRGQNLNVMTEFLRIRLYGIFCDKAAYLRLITVLVAIMCLISINEINYKKVTKSHKKVNKLMNIIFLILVLGSMYDHIAISRRQLIEYYRRLF